MDTASGLLTRELNTEVQEHGGQTVCRHYWVIEAPNGPMSRGECKYCHAEKEFQNSLRDFNHTTDANIAYEFGHEGFHKLARPARKPIA